MKRVFLPLSVLGLMVSGCVVTPHHAPVPRAVVVQQPAPRVMYEQPATQVIVTEPARRVVVTEQPARRVVVTEPQVQVVVPATASPRAVPEHSGNGNGRFCPPGQAKKGNC